jgi:signal transduction histidine kinase
MLDTKTVVFSYAITNILIALFIALLWYQNRKHYVGLGLWLIDYVLQAVALLLLLSRDVAPDLVSIVVANTLIMIGILCIFIGLERFVSKPSSQTHNYILIACFAGLMTFFTFVQPNIDIRTIFISVVTMLLTFQCGWLMLGRVEPSLRPITRDIGWVFLLYALVALVRTFDLIGFPLLATTDLFQLPSVQVIFILINQMLNIALTFTLILMVTRRLWLDVQRQAAARQRAEQAIQHLASFPRLNPNPVLEVDAQGNTTFQNDAATALLARVKRDVRVLLPPDLPEILQSFARQESQMAYREVELDGVILGESISHVPQSNVARIYTIDITARKRAEAALKEYSERLEQMVEERTRELRDAQGQLIRQERLTILGQLAGGIGHELRSPLGAIKNAVYLLNLSLPSPDPETAEVLQILNHQVANADRVITSLMDFARFQPPYRRATDVRATIDAALAQSALPANVTVNQQYAETLPPLMADPHQLQIVFGNLMRNAAQAMPNGGQLTIAAQRSDTELAISFRDTGVGIAPDVLDKIFQPMFTTKSRGLGLGLALCKLLVEGHGGRIEVTSQVGKGTIVVVYLPLPQEARDE